MTARRRLPGVDLTEVRGCRRVGGGGHFPRHMDIKKDEERSALIVGLSACTCADVQRDRLCERAAPTY